MGADLSFVSEYVREHNGALAESVLSDIIDVIDDDKKFKTERITALVNNYMKNRKSV